MKLAVAAALAHHPQLLVLDEATSGLDPVMRDEMLDIFLGFVQEENHSVLLSSHITSDLEHIADNIIFLNEGTILLNDTRDNIIDNYAILKCDKDYFSKIDDKDIVSYKMNKYDCEVLVNNIRNVKKKYKECVVDKVTIEELMIMMIKGDRIW